MAKPKGKERIKWDDNPLFRNLLVNLIAIHIKNNGGNFDLPSRVRTQIAKDFQHALPWFFDKFEKDKTKAVLQQINWVLTKQKDSSLTIPQLRTKVRYQTLLSEILKKDIKF